MPVFVCDSENMCGAKWLSNKFSTCSHASPTLEINTHSAENKHAAAAFGFDVIWGPFFSFNVFPINNIHCVFFKSGF